MYMRLQSGLVVSATRWVPKSILLHECCPLLLGFANAPDTLSIPALQFTFAMSRVAILRVRQLVAMVHTTLFNGRAPNASALRSDYHFVSSPR